MSTDLTDGMMPKTVQGSTVKVDLSDGVKINDSKVTTADVEATNGVIQVLLPAAGESTPTTVPKTGDIGMLPLISTAILSGLGYVALKKKR